MQYAVIACLCPFSTNLKKHFLLLRLIGNNGKRFAQEIHANDISQICGWGLENGWTCSMITLSDRWTCVVFHPPPFKMCLLYVEEVFCRVNAFPFPVLIVCVESWLPTMIIDNKTATACLKDMLKKFMLLTLVSTCLMKEQESKWAYVLQLIYFQLVSCRILQMNVFVNYLLNSIVVNHGVYHKVLENPRPNFGLTI